MVSTIMGGFIMVVAAIVIVAMVISFVKNVLGPSGYINFIFISIEKMEKGEYCESAKDYITDTLNNLDIKLTYDYNDFLEHVTEVDIKHSEYGDVYYYRRRNSIEESHNEYIPIYKDINDIFDEASRITSKDDAVKAKLRLEQMANYNRDTYQVTKKMNS